MGGTALVLSGGGSRGSFQIGAVKYLYERRGINPNFIVGSSVGAIHAAKLAEAKPGDTQAQLQSVADLISVWTDRMQSKSNMYEWAPWIRSALDDAELRKLDALISAGGLDNFFSKFVPDPLTFGVQTAIATGYGAPWFPAVAHALSLVDDVAFMVKLANLLNGRHGSSLMSLRPLRDLMPLVLKPELTEVGTELRLAVVSLDDMQLRWTDGQRRLRSATDEPCEDVPQVPDLFDCVMASAAMPVAFAPVKLSDGQTYTDGGVREIVPTALLKQRAPDEVYTVICSPRERLDPYSLPGTPVEWSVGDVAKRMLDIILDEVVEGDLAAVASHPAHHVIVPDITVHDTTVIDPGLIDINMLYGYLAADDVVAGKATGNQDRLRAMTNAVVRLRVASRYDEISLTGPNIDDEKEKRTVNATRWLIREVLGARTALGGVVPDAAWYRAATRMPADIGTPTVTEWLTDTARWRNPSLFLREADGTIWAVVGGAPFALPTMDDYNALKTTMVDDDPVPLPFCRAPQHLRRVPAAGFFVKERDAAPIFVSDGVKLWHVPSMEVLTAMGADTTTRPVWPLPSGALAGLPVSPVPVNFAGPFTVAGRPLMQPSSDVHVAHSKMGEPPTLGVLMLQAHRAVTVTGVRVEDSTGSFTLHPSTVTSKRVANGEQLPVAVEYAPRAPGATVGVDQRAVVVVETNDPRQSIQSFVIVGTPGTAVPEAEVVFTGRTPWLSFGKVSVGTTASGVVSIANIGTREAHISAIKVTGPGADQFAGPYTWPVISPGATVDLPFFCTPTPPSRSAPTAPGRLHKSFSTRRDVTATATITFQTRPGKEAALSRRMRASVGIAKIGVPRTVTFPTVTEGGVARATMQVSNSGNVDLVVRHIRLPAGPIDLDPLVTLPLTVPAGGNRQVGMRYHGLHAGTAHEADCVVESNDPVRPAVSVLLEGRTSGPELVLVDNQEMVDFAEVPVGSSETGTFRIRNAGDQPTSIDKLRVSTGSSSTDLFTTTAQVPHELAPGVLLEVEVTFAPDATGQAWGQIEVFSPHRPDPLWVGLRGEGV